MDKAQLLGYTAMAIIEIGALIAVISKFTQPINELRLVIQKLSDKIDGEGKAGETRDKRIEKHGEQIDELGGQVHKLGDRVGKLETKVNIYHQN